MRRALLATLVLLASVPARAEPPVIVVFFPEWSGALDPSAKDVVAHAAEAAKARPDAGIRVTAYADANGSNRANLYLTQLRAQRIFDLLVADGVAPARIEMSAKGRQPIKGQVSRRVDIEFK